MHTTTHISSDLNRIVMLRSFHQRNIPRIKPSTTKNRSESVFGTKSYSDALQRAFNKAKMQIFFNPDMVNFVTLTYKGIETDIEKAMQDVKILVKAEKRNGNHLKYIYVFEWQKRGSLHIHMITNNALTTTINKNGYRTLKHWNHGYDSILTINDFDNNFKPYLYLFKYMKKAQRIGKSFVHSSRNLNNFIKLEDSSINLEHWRTINMEYTHSTVQTTNFHYFKNYLQFDDTINPSTNEGELSQWQEQVQLHSKKELEKILANLTAH